MTSSPNHTLGVRMRPLVAFLSLIASLHLGFAPAAAAESACQGPKFDMNQGLNGGSCPALKDLLRGSGDAQYLLLDFSQSFCGPCLQQAMTLASKTLKPGCRVATLVGPDREGPDIDFWRSALKSQTASQAAISNALEHSHEIESAADLVKSAGLPFNSTYPYMVLVGPDGCVLAQGASLNSVRYDDGGGLKNFTQLCTTP